MKRSTVRMRAAGFASAVAVALVLAPAIASAPTDQYQTFNRNDVTITDVNTGLVWQREVVLPAKTQAAAMSYCQSFQPNPPDGLQWRLPTMKELLTIVDETPHYEFENGVNQAKMIDVNAFPRSPTNFEYWSSTPSAADPVNDGWAVKFRTGENVTQGQNQSGYVRCVRP